MDGGNCYFQGEAWDSHAGGTGEGPLGALGPCWGQVAGDVQEPSILPPLLVQPPPGGWLGWAVSPLGARWSQSWVSSALLWGLRWPAEWPSGRLRRPDWEGWVRGSTGAQPLNWLAVSKSPGRWVQQNWEGHRAQSLKSPHPLEEGTGERVPGPPHGPQVKPGPV